MSVDGVQDRFTVRDVKDIINGRPGGSGTSVKKQKKFIKYYSINIIIRIYLKN